MIRQRTEVSATILYHCRECFGHWILKFEIYPSTGLRVVSPSTLLRTVSLSNGLSNHLLFGAWDL
jgi:hypothetical protein